MWLVTYCVFRQGFVCQSFGCQDCMNNQISTLKNRQRQQALKLRDELNPEARIEKSIQASDAGSRAIEFQPGEIISGFWPIRSEIDARPLMAALQQRGARLCLPVVVDKYTIIFRELVRGAPLVKAGFGTVGPGPEAGILNPSTLLVPLAAFDLKGGRLGYGAGHYDRAIDKLMETGITPRLIGVAFDIQRVDRVFTEPHDQNLDAIITESGVVFTDESDLKEKNETFVSR